MEMATTSLVKSRGVGHHVEVEVASPLHSLKKVQVTSPSHPLEKVEVASPSHFLEKVELKSLSLYIYIY